MKFRQYCYHHARAFFLSLGQLYHQPLANFLTLLVIAIALMLPTGLFVVLQNLSQLSGDLNSSTQITLYLKKTVTESRAQNLTAELQKRNAIQNAVYISPEQGLQELSQTSNFSTITSAITTNPLPGVITIQPTKLSQLELDQLASELSNLPQVANTQLDMAWIERWFSILQLGDRLVFALGLVFGLGVLLIIGNTIYLATQSQRREIQIFLLAGASDAFVRRPFLYCGLLYGILGALLADMVMGIITMWLSKPMTSLAQLYDNTFTLHGLGFGNSLSLLIIGGVLGLLAAFVVVNHQLKLHYHPQ